MSPEATVVLASATFGSVYLCATSLEEINKNKLNYISFPFLCNYFILGLSSGIFMCITGHMLKNKN